MSRSPIDRFAEELQLDAEPADPFVLAWLEIVAGLRRFGIFTAALFAIVFGAALVFAIATGAR